jgi:uncharacterized OB-fold protein
MPRPVPEPDELSRPFWDACNERRLVVQYCTMCDRRQFPPTPVCGGCGWHFHLSWLETSGRGTIDGGGVTHQSRIQAWQEDQPYNNAVITLEEDPAIQFFSNLSGVPVDQIPVGAKVQVEFLEVEPGRLIPEWRVVS